MLPTVVMSPPVFPFTCQFTAKPPAFCTVAMNCTVVPVNGCAEAGETGIVTGGGGGGAPEDTRPPQEIRNIASSGEKRNKRREGRGRGGDWTYGWGREAEI